MGCEETGQTLTSSVVVATFENAIIGRHNHVRAYPKLNLRVSFRRIMMVELLGIRSLRPRYCNARSIRLLQDFCAKTII
jgi:hypothetical protein